MDMDIIEIPGSTSHSFKLRRPRESLNSFEVSRPTSRARLENMTLMHRSILKTLTLTTLNRTRRLWRLDKNV